LRARESTDWMVKTALTDALPRNSVWISDAQRQAPRAEIRQRLVTALMRSGDAFSLLPAAFAAWLPPLWIVLVAAIVVGIVIAYFKAAEIKDWISRCKFSKGEHYRSLDDELKAFNSAIGG